MKDRPPPRPTKNPVVAFEPRPGQFAVTIRKLATAGKIGWGNHVLERMEERGIDRLDAIRVLKFGEIKGEIEPGRSAGEWKCKMAYQSKGSREIGVVTVVLNFERLFLKTVEWEDR